MLIYSDITLMSPHAYSGRVPYLFTRTVAGVTRMLILHVTARVQRQSTVSKYAYSGRRNVHGR